MTQNIWSQGEADAWFERNESKFPDAGGRTDVIDLLEFIDRQHLKVSSVLEIGCSSGTVVEAIAIHTGARGVGVDLSEKAITEGNQRLDATDVPVELVVGTAARLPFEDHEFDVVVGGFFLYAIPQNQLLCTLAEIDRVLKPGGYLSVLDFAFPHFISVPYAHEPGSTVAKRKYVDILTSTQHYSVAFARTYSEESGAFSEDPNQRIGFSILFKEPQPYLHVG